VPFAHEVTYSEHSFALGRLGRPGESCPEVGGALTQASAASPSPGLATDADARRAGADDKDVCGVSAVTASFLR
jgi:hypothetical protein